mmetsp:Transcript_104439/g.302177  ORF Transcript_104439/g.302177 Transcript_104439/m.302177 type:complete len:246 (+) Transcript_104439:1486-2223(+)
MMLLYSNASAGRVYSNVTSPETGGPSEYWTTTLSPVRDLSINLKSLEFPAVSRVLRVPFTKIDTTPVDAGSTTTWNALAFSTVLLCDNASSSTAGPPGMKLRLVMGSAISSLHATVTRNGPLANGGAVKRTSAQSVSYNNCKSTAGIPSIAIALMRASIGNSRKGTLVGGYTVSIMQRSVRGHSLHKNFEWFTLGNAAPGSTHMGTALLVFCSGISKLNLNIVFDTRAKFDTAILGDKDNAEASK